MKKIEFRPIGIIHSEFKEPKEMPIQPIGGKNIKATVEIFPEFAAGLQDLGGFSHIVLIYQFHLSESFKLRVFPFMENEFHGVFATRAPHRPNQIGISIVRLEKIENNILTIANVDIVDGTPLLDLKPFVKEFDCFDLDENYRVGWLQNRVKNTANHRADERFWT